MDSTSTTGVMNIQETALVNVAVDDFVINKTFTENAKKEKILQELDISIYEYLSQRVIPESPGVRIMATNNIQEIVPSEFEGVKSFVNLKKVNNIQYINKFFNQVNRCLPDAGRFIGCVEAVSYKKERILKKRNIFTLIYWFYCFIFHRVFSKTKFLKNIYFFLTKGRYRWLSKAEILGRLASCGFEIIEYKRIGNRLYFEVIKTSEPSYNKNPSFGPFFPMKRVGKNGNMIKVYKLRTMHPYSEYLQDFVVKMNGYNHVGKPSNDFRLTGWGKFYRKYWLDELPQLLNVLKGELGLVGVRPLSKTRFNELPEDVQKERIKFKPGCIPPYVSLNMPDSNGNIEAERIYMKERGEKGFVIDVKYFFLALFNIFTGKIKSS